MILSHKLNNRELTSLLNMGLIDVFCENKNNNEQFEFCNNLCKIIENKCKEYHVNDSKIAKVLYVKTFVIDISVFLKHLEKTMDLSNEEEIEKWSLMFAKLFVSDFDCDNY